VTSQTHDIAVKPTQKMDTPTGLFRGVCSCGWLGGVDTQKFATKAALQHKEAKERQALAEVEMMDTSDYLGADRE
jgi:hypothetical protein